MAWIKELGLFQTATAIVLSNDTPAIVRALARVAKVALGALIQVCDEVADQVEINAAINALPVYAGKRHGRIVFVGGMFRTSDTINVDGDITLEGQMMPIPTYDSGTTIRNENIAGADAFHLLAPGGFPDHVIKVVLRNMCIRGNAASGHGVYADKVHFTLYNIVLLSHGGDGIYVEACWGGSIIESDIRNNEGAGVSYNRDAVTGHTCTWQLIDHCNIGHNHTNADIYMPDYTAELIVRACYFEHGDDIGAIHHIEIGGGSNVTICDGCRLAANYNIAATPIHISNGGRVRITDNFIGGDAARCIEIAIGVSTDIIGNDFIAGWTEWCIHCSVTGGSVLIDDNYFPLDQDTYPDCIIARLVADNAIFTNNRAIATGTGNNRTAVHLINVDNCVVSDNILLGPFDNTWIRLDPGNYCTLEGNTIEGASGLGIYLASTSSYNTVVGDICRGNNIGIELGADSHHNTAKSNSCPNNATVGISNNGTDNITDVAAHSIALDLSGGATDIEVYHAKVACSFFGYEILYTEASSVNAGVNVRIGRYQDGVALDDDYFDVSVSEVSKNKGYSKQFDRADLTQSVIAAGDTITAGIAGGKVGTGEVLLILQIAETG